MEIPSAKGIDMLSSIWGSISTNVVIIAKIKAFRGLVKSTNMKNVINKKVVLPSQVLFLFIGSLYFPK